MASVKISGLQKISSITNDDFIPVVDSGSLTTYRADFNAVHAWLSSSATASHALTSISASYAKSASTATTSSYSDTASFLLYQGFFNGTASYAISTSLAETASYFDTTNFSATYATYAISASWASSSVSASYVSASNVDGTVVSASYSLTSSFSVSSSYNISSSYAVTASYAWSSSWAATADTTTANPMSIYGPFTSSADVSGPAWGQWDSDKKSISFTLANDSDVVIECLANYASSEGAPGYAYVAAIVRASGADDPITNPPTLSQCDDIKFCSIQDDSWSETDKLDGVVHLFFRKSLTAGTWVIYLLAGVTSTNVSAWTGLGEAQKTYIDTFLASTPVSTAYIRFYNFANSAQACAYATETITQA